EEPEHERLDRSEPPEVAVPAGHLHEPGGHEGHEREPVELDRSAPRVDVADQRGRQPQEDAEARVAPEDVGDEGGQARAEDEDAAEERGGGRALPAGELEREEDGHQGHHRPSEEGTADVADLRRRGPHGRRRQAHALRPVRARMARVSAPVSGGGSTSTTPMMVPCARSSASRAETAESALVRTASTTRMAPSRMASLRLPSTGAPRRGGALTTMKRARPPSPSRSPSRTGASAMRRWREAAPPGPRTRRLRLAAHVSSATSLGSSSPDGAGWA